MSLESVQKTPLAAVHQHHGGRMIDFGGWWMPVQYQGILQEHEAVRNRAGLFDISHMGEFFVSGPQAATQLNRWLTNDVGRLRVGQGQYTLLLNPEGGVIDDLICYRIAEENYLLVVNAARIEEDFEWVSAHQRGSCVIENQSAAWAAMAIQGPRSAAIVEKITRDPLPARNEIRSCELSSGRVWIARTGYTGEDGFEWFCSAKSAEVWWKTILEAGSAFGLMPCGLGCRDTLRLEMGYPLNGADLSRDRTPLEAGLSAFVRFEKGSFIGSDALLKQKQQGIPSKLCGLVMEGKTPPPRAHYPVLFEGKPISETTSGSLSPSMQAGIAMAYLPLEISSPSTLVQVDIRGKLFPAKVTKRPMYTPALSS